MPAIRSDQVALPGRLGDVSFPGTDSESFVVLLKGELVFELPGDAKVGARVGVCGVGAETLVVAGVVLAICGALPDVAGCQTAGVGSRAGPVVMPEDREDGVASVGLATLGVLVAP